jgi:oligogalacturonide transporter
MADVDEIVTGRRREGAFAGVMTFVRKMSQAIALIAVGQILQLSGFVAGATSQSSVTVHAIVAVMIGGTLAILAFGLWVSLRFRLDPTTHAVLMDEIERLRAGATTPASPQSGAIVEDLSGWRYDQLWGRNPVL